MSDPEIFKRRPQDEEDHDTRRARLQYGPDKVNESVKNWGDYTSDEKDVIIAEGNAIYSDIARAMEADKAATDPEVQALFERWQYHLGYFYEPTLEIMAGLGEMYATSDEFRATFEKVHPNLPDFLREGIAAYVDALETQAIQDMLDEDEG